MHPRFKYFPWQKDYAAQPNIYSPHVMALAQPGYRSEAVNIDAFGFRVQYDASGRRIDLDSARDTYSACTLLLGNSTGFGVSSTADAKTVGHYLASSDSPCINMSVRGANMQQELALFQTFKPCLPAVKRIVLLSGICDVSLATQPEDLYPGWIGGMHSQAVYHNRYLEHYDSLDGLGMRAQREFHVWAEWVYRRSGWIQRRCEKRVTRREPALPQPVTSAVFEENLGRVLAIAANVVQTWGWLQKGSGIPVYFVLQPVVGWTTKPPTECETACLEADAQRVPAIGLYANRAVHGRVAAHFARACAKEGVSFLDANTFFDTLDAQAGDMFSDICHLTDNGAQRLGRWLAAKLPPAGPLAASSGDTA